MPARRPISLAGLRGFLAVARSGGFTRAAARLHLTQSALSRQIQALEEEVGCPLLVRTTRRVETTAAGEALLRAAAVALDGIDACVAQLRHPAQRARVSVSTFVSFASLWLIPRLGRFSADNPDVDVDVMANDRVVPLDAEGFDLAMRCSSAPLAGPDAEFLFAEFLIPVCSPSYFAAAPRLRSPADIRQHTLLRIDEASEALTPMLTWEYWLANNGCAGLGGRNEIRLTNNDQVVQAALAGQGVALARAALIVDLVAAGHLLPLFNYPYPTRYAYYMVSTELSRRRPAVIAFASWIAAESVQTREQLARLGGSAAPRGKPV